MQLWQMDVMAGVMLDDGSDLKVVTGIDDHSRFCVAASLVARATARAVCGVFSDAMKTYGVPDEVLTDNGKVFTGRFGLHHSEVLFDRICRENGISHRLTTPRSPSTTGKIERFHQSLRKNERERAEEALSRVRDSRHRRPGPRAASQTCPRTTGSAGATMRTKQRSRPRSRP